MCIYIYIAYLWVANDTFMDQLITRGYHPCAKGQEEKAVFLSDL